MARRPIFVPTVQGRVLVETMYAEFQWHPGMAASQKQKSVSSLHAVAIEHGICRVPLEISTKSTEPLGVSLSAFNLEITTRKLGKTFSVEAAYQSSKVFERGGPFVDLLMKPAREAKADLRLKESGELTGFLFFGEEWSLDPRTSFYDWLYLNALNKCDEAVRWLDEFDAFTDIEFNPSKSVNCQAYSVALYKSLQARGLIAEALSHRAAFLNVLAAFCIQNASENTARQPRLV
ncbi:MAG: hypothetical protein Q8O29_19905 [Polaromonas sp.]|uniref:DarT1-associated NADAR antitoxin family protein n=1 Tax=Polaromonas sp. TaxID=1869339 RepID=UPI0027362206|nr:hypothetical protein [Polaromonas sp.]MDP2820497.1 hypothetical protein [Polaromonas sp.]